ncbi:MAG: excinuclease ABC subunit UvrC, partial [Oscillospiraceae bacterium]
LKDDKGYAYIKITNEDYPKIIEVKQKLEDNAEYIGPYTSSYTVRQSVEEVNKIFKLPTCNKKFPRDFHTDRPCLNYHINRCMGVCKANISQEDYNQNIVQAIEYLKTGNKNIVLSLTEQMQKASANLEFEKAAKIRDKISAIKKVSETQKVVMNNVKEQDVIAFESANNKICAVILKFRNFALVDKDDYICEVTTDIQSAKVEFLIQYYENKEIPRNVLFDEQFDEIELIKEYLTTKSNHKVDVGVPQRGENKHIVSMAIKNAQDKLLKSTEYINRDMKALEELALVLNLNKIPRYIESYDISNLGDSGIVGAMVVFKDAKPYKTAYRKFKIESVAGQDDYASMKEVITRRFNRYVLEKDSGEGFGILPDLILLDGGKGHVGVIAPIIEDFNLPVKVFGMVKDGKHKTRAIAVTGGEIEIASYRLVFSLITKIQDEVHRFAIGYQHKVNKKRTFDLTLTEVDGIGTVKAEMLIKFFKTKQALKLASVDELKKVAKVGDKTAQNLFEFIKQM